MLLAGGHFPNYDFTEVLHTELEIVRSQVKDINLHDGNTTNVLLTHYRLFNVWRIIIETGLRELILFGQTAGVGTIIVPVAPFLSPVALQCETSLHKSYVCKHINYAYSNVHAKNKLTWLATLSAYTLDCRQIAIKRLIFINDHR